MTVSPAVLRRFTLAALAVFPAVVATAAPPKETAPLVRLTFQPETPDGRLGEERTSEGKILVEDEAGGVLLLDRGGRLWPVTRERVKSREETGDTFRPYTLKEAAAEMQKELGQGFTIVTTKHYVLASEADREYARWAGMLFERLMAAFGTFWGRSFEVGEPEFPLIAVILKDERRFKEFALADAGPDVLEALGYYSTMTNRMVMYDLTAGLGGQRPRNALEMNVRLAGQISNVSTIVHEATHQIAFNSGMHTRLADNPFWLVEGMAMFFETPDLKSPSGWRTVAQVNPMRLRNFRDFMKTRRPSGSLKAMLTADEKFHTANTALDAYAEAWALSYYLIIRHKAKYAEYLRTIAAKKPLEKDEAEERLAEFEAAFGDVADVERDFTRFIATK
jgi:Protein of unknown function (DUF1570)